MKPVRLLIIGAGSRGSTYAGFAELHPDRARVVGVAEPREHYRQTLAQRFDIPAENCFHDWREAAARSPLADAVIIATRDDIHAEPAITFAQQGYHILLEKPMAPNEADCHRIVEAVLAAEVIFAVCHVLRYTDYTRTLKRVLDSGAVGEIVSVQHLEPIGYWHHAHSFVRGNWRKERESSPLLLSKSCHDLDWLRYLVGSRCLAVSSFGTLKHFRASERPAAAAERCIDCAVEPDCPYSAPRFYLGRLERGYHGWPLDVITPELTSDGVLQALQHGPYGRCVYACDNDVVDNQVVNLLFEQERTVSFSMVAFTESTPRRTRIFGTRGELQGDGLSLRLFDFLRETTTMIAIEAEPLPGLRGHGGGDYRMLDRFVAAVATGNPTLILSGPQETLETHRMVFAAELARREQRVVTLD